MASSTERRIDDISYAANKHTEAQKFTFSLNRYFRHVRVLFHNLLAAGAVVSCLYSAQGIAGVDTPFINALGQPAQDIASQQARITELENQATPDTYNPDLGEAYLELANKQAAMENYTAALNTYNRALQSVRVNDGLNSRNQLPILQAQLVAMEKLEQWKRYDSTLNLIYLISQDQFPVGDNYRIKVLDQLSKWQLRAAEENLLDRVEPKARALADLYEKEFSQIEATDMVQVSDYGLSSLQLGNAYNRLTMTKIAFNKPAREYRALTSEPTLAGSRCRPVRLAAGGNSATCMAAPMPDLNYYQAPARRKQQETFFYLEGLRTAILDAGETLEEKKQFDNRNILINDFRFLAESYSHLASLAQAK